MLFGDNRMKTVKQIADEIGVTKQALQKRMSREPLCTTLIPYVSMQGTTKYIDEVGETLIISAFKGIDKSIDMPTDKGMDTGIDSIRTGIDAISESLIDLLRLDIEAKNRQIDGMQRTIDAQQETIHAQAENIKDLTASLNAAQALHAGTIQAQLEASATTETSTTVEQEQDMLDEPVDDAPHPARRWWQFWK